MMKKMILFFLAIILLAGCTPYMDDSDIFPPETIFFNTPSPTAAPLPPQITPIVQSGGVISVTMPLPQTLNPLLNTDPAVDLALQLMFQPLAVIGDNLFPIANENLVESITFSTDGTVAFVTLINNARWSDGTMITASDVVFSINLLKDAPLDVFHKNRIENILSASATDSRTTRIVLNTPTGGAAYFLCFPIIPESHFGGAERLNIYASQNMNPVGSGAFRFNYRHYAQYISLVRNDYAPNVSYLNGIKIILTSDDDTNFHAFSQNVAQTYFAPFYDRRLFRDLPNTTAKEFPSRYFEFVGFNHNMPLFQDEMVRRAIAYCLPINEIQRDAFAGSLFPAPAFVATRSWLFDPTAAHREPNIDIAREALLSSTFSPHNHNLIITILVNNDNYERVRTAEILRNRLNRIGFASTVDAVPFEVYLQRLEANNFDLFIGGFSMGLNSDFAFAIGSGGVLGFSNTQTDALLNNILTSATRDDYFRYMGELQRHILEYLPFIGLGFRNSALLVRSHVNGTTPASPTNAYMGVNNWWIEN